MYYKYNVYLLIHHSELHLISCITSNLFLVLELNPFMAIQVL